MRSKEITILVCKPLVFENQKVLLQDELSSLHPIRLSQLLHNFVLFSQSVHFELLFSATDQSSDPVAMKAGYTYFIEAQSFHDNKDSPMKVGVRVPSGKIYAPIPSKFLRLERGGELMTNSKNEFVFVSMFLSL